MIFLRPLRELSKNIYNIWKNIMYLGIFVLMMFRFSKNFFQIYFWCKFDKFFTRHLPSPLSIDIFIQTNRQLVIESWIYLRKVDVRWYNEDLLCIFGDPESFKNVLISKTEYMMVFLEWRKYYSHQMLLVYINIIILLLAIWICCKII